MTLLAAHEVSVIFGGGPVRHTAVSDVSLEIAKGECLGVVGESGSGKSTLARVLVGLQRPTRGEVRLDGNLVVDAQRSRFASHQRRRVQMVFQDPYDSLNPRLRAIDTVAEAIRFCQGGSASQTRERGYRLLLSMGVPREQADLHPRQLSGGQRQRISVARALAADPDLLVADEPTSSIDQSAQAQLLNLLRSLQRDRQLAIIFISHDLSLVGYLSSRLLVMRAGIVVEQGHTSQVLSRPTHPYTRALLQSIPGRRRRPDYAAGRSALSDPERLRGAPLS